MRSRENRAVLAALAATAGAGFSSGREIALFFAQTGWASWIGVAFSAAIFGLLCMVVCHFAVETGERRFAFVYARVLGPRQGCVIGQVHDLLMAMTAGVMLAASGELAMLSLPFKNAFWMGMLISLIAALLLNMRNMAYLPMAGAAAVGVCGAFYAALALDPRPVTIHRQYVAVAELSGSVTGALVLSGLHAAFSASVAAGMAVRFADREISPVRFGAKCGGLMMILLAAANGAILSGGSRLLPQALPAVVLAARWGIAGYWLSIIVMWLCCATTLAAALGSLGGRRSARRWVFWLLAGGAAAVIAGPGAFVKTAYPMVGWACAVSLAGLACCFDYRDVMCRKSLRIMTKSRVKL